MFYTRVVLCSCAVLCFTLQFTDAIEMRSSLLRSPLNSRRREQVSHGGTDVIAGRPSSGLKIRFRPTNVKCCKVGVRTARKGLSCDLGVHAVYRKSDLVRTTKYKTSGPTRWIYSHYFAQVLAQKIAKCEDSVYSKNFEKCCLYRQNYMRDLELCKKYKSKRSKKLCRHRVKRRYP